jgi:predicted RNA-binding protein with PIN domain
MACVIDGYNLLHAMGILGGRTGPMVLRKARLGLLGLLRSAYGDEASTVTVVFDAADAPPGVPAEQEYKGIHIRFAVHQEEADDLIEALIRQDSAPRQLTVVSDDHRIQKAARRRRCTLLGCTEYLEWLDKHRRERRQPPSREPVKPEVVSRDEAQHWLQEFADLQNDPKLRELSDPWEWEEEIS